MTGAARGIGKAIALEFAKEGANVAFTDLAIDENGKATEAEIAALGVKAKGYASNAANFEETHAVIDQIIKDFGRIDILVNNAGITKDGLMMRMSEAQWDAVLTVNLTSAFNFIHAVVPVMARQKSGSIITTCSMDGKKGVPPDAAYVGTKFAMNGFFQVLRQELRGSGVHVGIIYPSRMDTPQIAHVDCPKLTPKGDPDMVAKAVIRSVVKKKKELMVPSFSCHLLTWADAISPSFSDWLVRVNHLAGTVNDTEPINEAK